MAVKYILRQVGLKAGLNPDDAGERSLLLRWLNEAAMECYEQSDPEGSLLEDIFQVNGDQTIALPPEVGPIRAMREYTTHVAWHLNTMRPRYNASNWQDRWRNWRIKGESPLQAPIVNESVVTATVKAVETPPVVVYITGSTPDSSNITEALTMSSLMVTSANTFNEIRAVSKDRVNIYDITLSDVDGNALSVLPNNLIDARFQIVDVSLYPWSSTTVNIAEHTMEVLYKKALPWLSNDNDEFPVKDYDNILVNKMLQLWAEEQGKADEAVGYDTKASRSMGRKKEDKNRGAEQQVALSENAHDTMLPRNRPLGPNRYSGQVFY